MILQIVVHAVFIVTTVRFTSTKKRQLKQLKKQYEELLKHQKTYNESLYQELREIKHFRHDLKNHFINLCILISLGRNEEALSYLNKIDDTMSEFSKTIIDTGNHLIDIMTSIKQMKCVGYLIKFSAPTLKLHSISESDLSLLLACALDNSIEACKKIKDFTHRYIIVEIIVKANMLIIKIKNPVKQEDTTFKIKKDNTTKSDRKNHGFGIETMRAIVKKYNGELYFENSEIIFCVRVVLYDD